MKYTAILALFTIAATARVIELDLSSPTQFNEIQEANINDVVMMKLPENPTTGYSWLLVNRPSIDIQCLALSKVEYFPNNNHQDEFFGAGGIKYYNFLAKQAGSETVEFISSHIWDKQNYTDAATGRVDVAHYISNDPNAKHVQVKFLVSGTPSFLA
ncbi:UNKNOWN [Stylonychia lemnae]|uniref:Proteinase inhibitor I42 chagasin domain-containing protein n=1 Tax=Stylonychia lemnae TaxID=5949 RepID=A0A077ZZH5_STYLE|nr:UNKNOWN [Stylonychia lemnae]|eukprot:CDW74638.1 UNKNOWN [Stylonychia lemnae]